jgi:3-oxoacyl-[acyl-carrier-protein] synthase-3
MRWSDIYISASAAVLGHRVDIATAVADGRYDPTLQRAHGYRSVCVADGGLPVDMAVQAARAALARSRVDASDIRLVVHASSTRQGPDELAPASYIQGRTFDGTASALEVKQSCNGALAALEVASAYLSTAPARSSALLTTSEMFADEARYREDPGCVGADGATGVVLSRGTGVARLLSTAVVGDGRFADVGVALDQSGAADRQAATMQQRKRLLLAMLESMFAVQRETIEGALADADAKSTEISRWVFPNIGANMVDREFRKGFGIDDSRTTWEWGRTVGHLGTGNQFAGLTHLLEVGAVRTGDRVALCGNGVGFSYGCAVLEIVREPDWSGPADAGG